MSKMIILAAVSLLSGGTVDGNGKLTPCDVQPGDELTDEKIAALGMSAADVEHLKATGAVAEKSVQTAEDADFDAAGEALAAAEVRADAAETRAVQVEAERDALQQQVEQLTAELAVAPAAEVRADAAEARAVQAEGERDTLQQQVEQLTAELATAPKPKDSAAKDSGKA